MKLVRLFKKGIILIVGIVVIILGIILLPAPGPGLLVIAFGLFILSTEFAWAERRLATLKLKFKEISDKAKSRSNKDKK
jgi:uncharacterized protein (TIGR02611 family)